jgi:hypothetical protein
VIFRADWQSVAGDISARVSDSINHGAAKTLDEEWIISEADPSTNSAARRSHPIAAPTSIVSHPFGISALVILIRIA